MATVKAIWINLGYILPLVLGHSKVGVFKEIDLDMSQVTGRTIGRIVTFHTFKLLKQTQIAHQSLSLKLASNLGG